MASHNRHWPSMFKRSKPPNTHHSDINSSLMSNGFHFQRTTPDTPVGDERSPDPKPRWNPKPEQIRILEGIFNSGMVNPPREEIRKICRQLQEYGQLTEANVFYWFQNRKSRSKHKLRQLQKNKSQQNSPSPTLPQITPPSSSSSSSSSDKSSPQQIMSLPHNHKDFFNINWEPVPMLNSPTDSGNQTYFQTHMNENGFQLPPPAAATAETFPLPMLQHMNGEGVVAHNANIITTQGFTYPMLPHINDDQGAFANNIADITTTQGFDYLSEFSNIIQPQQNAVPCTTMNMNNIMHNHDPQLDFCLTSTSTDPITVPPFTTQIQGVGEVADGTAKSILVFINDVAYEVAVGPFNVREAFGDEAVLIHYSSGQPVPTDEWGFTLNSLQHAASYYLI